MIIFLLSYQIFFIIVRHKGGPMIPTGKGNFTFNIALFLLLQLYCSTFLFSQITFYSQTPDVARRNFSEHIFKNTSSYRKIIPLIGTWSLLNPKTREKIGEVRIPSVFHDQYTFIFQKSFKQLNDENSFYFLHFNGINGFAHIRINQRLFFRGSRNYLPIKIPIPSHLLTQNSNQIEIQIDPWPQKNYQFPPWFPINLPRIDNGIYRNVYLEVLPPTHISKVEAYSRLSGDSVHIQIKCTIRSSHPLMTQHWLYFQITNKNKSYWQKRIFLEPDSTSQHQEVELQVTLPRLEPWSPDKPNCYFLNTSLSTNNTILDVLQKSLPIRTIGWKNNKCFLNGDLIQITGINYIYQNLDGNILLDRSLLRRDLEQIKKDGFNAVRVGFYPQSDYFYYLTDSLGLICFQDLPFPFVHHNLLADSLGRSKQLEYLEAFTLLIADHPSVIGIGFPAYTTDVESSYLKEYFKSPLLDKYIVYLASPFPPESNTVPKHPHILEIIERNHQEYQLSNFLNSIPDNLPVFLSGLSKAISYRVDSSAITHDLQQITELYLRLKKPQWKDRFAGQFILTFSDYYLQTPTLQGSIQNNFQMNTIGIYNIQRSLKKEVGKLRNLNQTKLVNTEMESEKQQLGPFIFVIIGLINFLFFLLLYRSIIEFRHNIQRSIRKPHGFFTDLKERRIIPYTENFFLLIILSVNSAVIIGSTLYFFRNNLYMDYFLSLIFIDNRSKHLICSLIWQPHFLIPIITFIMALFVVLLSFPIWIISFFREIKVRFRHALAVSTWAASPFVMILPLGMFYYNLLLVLNSYWIPIIIILYFHIWYIFRWINGARVMTEARYARVFLFTIAIIIIFGTGTLFYWNIQVNVSEHLRFLLKLFSLL